MTHLYGKFVWFELCTSDLARARSFYGELFAWKVEDLPMGSIQYPMIKNGEAMLGGLVPLEEKGAKSHWISYLSVPNVDAAAKKVTALGGKIVRAPFDYPSVGRMALIEDSVGARFNLFTSGDGDAPDRETAPGDFFWNELWTADPKKATAFYADVGGVTIEDVPMGEMTYHVLRTGAVARAGVMRSPDPRIPTHWLPYVQVANADQTVARAKRLGGEIKMEPQDIPTIGRFAVLADPTGAAIAVITPEKK
jgi:uncharacterized protein